MLSYRLSNIILVACVQIFTMELLFGTVLADKTDQKKYTCEDKVPRVVCESFLREHLCIGLLGQTLKLHCLNYCNECHLDEKYTCSDKYDDDTCEALEKIGFCELNEVMNLMAVECPKTCGLCLHNGNESCFNQAEASHCRNLQRYCNSKDELGKRVREQCAFTCGCDTQATE